MYVILYVCLQSCVYEDIGCLNGWMCWCMYRILDIDVNVLIYVHLYICIYINRHTHIHIYACLDSSFFIPNDTSYLHTHIYIYTSTHIYV